MWHYNNPVVVHAGIGSLERLPALLGARRAILIAFPEAHALGLVGRLQTLLGARLLAVETDIRPIRTSPGWRRCTSGSGASTPMPNA